MFFLKTVYYLLSEVVGEYNVAQIAHNFLRRCVLNSSSPGQPHKMYISKVGSKVGSKMTLDIAVNGENN